MSPKRFKQCLWALVILFVANVVYQYFANWGLITVKVHNAPLGQVIKSIEWQGWVKIYTNIDPKATVSMYVDHVPLAEAMETLSVNIDIPRPPDNGPDNGAPGGNPPDRTAFGGQPGNGNQPAGGPPGGGQPGGGQPDRGNIAGQPGNGNQPGGGPPGGGQPGGGRPDRNFGGGFVQWNLAFFIAPTSADVKNEILAFQQDNQDDDTKIFTYPTPIQMLAANGDMPATDPRKQSWPGVKAAPPAPPAPAATADSTNAAPDVANNTPFPTTNTPPPANEPATKTALDYLKAFARSANIWIMAPSSWTPEVATPPPANSSIVSAITGFVSRLHGSVTEAIILRSHWNGNAGRGGFADGGFDDMADRLRNAITGLPADAQADALSQLDDQVRFFKDLQSAPQDQRRQRLMDHMTDRIVSNLDSPRRSPEKRAQRYQRLVAARMAATGK